MKATVTGKLHYHSCHYRRPQHYRQRRLHRRHLLHHPIIVIVIVNITTVLIHSTGQKLHPLIMNDYWRNVS